MSTVKSASFLSTDAGSFRYVEKSNPHTSNLQFLTYVKRMARLSGPICSGALAHPAEEALLFSWKGTTSVRMNGEKYLLENVRRALCAPRGAAFQLEQTDEEQGDPVPRAGGQQAHPAFHARWKEFSG